MPRPFRKLVALDLEDTAATVIEALKKHKPHKKGEETGGAEM